MIDNGLDWIKLNIEDVCDILDSQRIPINAEEREKRIGDVPYYGANGLQGYIDDYIFDEPLILMAEDGGRFEEYATRPIAYKIYGKSWVNNHAHVLRAKEQYSQNFIFYSLEHKDIQPYIVGGTRSKLNQSALRKIEIRIPEVLEEQSKIGEILETVDSAIEKTEELITKQERIKAGLMQDLLTKGIDENGNIRSEETHEFKDSSVGRIPVEWHIRTINDLATHVGSGVTPKGGESVYQKEGILFIRSQNVHYSGLDLSDIAYISNEIHNTMKRSEIFVNDILLNITGASIGRCCIVPKFEGEMNVNQHVCSIRLYDSNLYNSGYVSIVLESVIGKKQIMQYNSGGNREGLNYENIRSFNIPWPIEEERKNIFKIMDEINQSIETEKKQLSKYKRLKLALMQDLLTGKKRVTSLLDDLEVVS